MSATVPLEPLLVTPEEAARLLSLSPRTLARLTAAGEIRPVRAGRSVRYDRRELERWIEQAQQPRPSNAG
jgi:excisionase family DNA binding protein